jgi:hypothetical protein
VTTNYADSDVTNSVRYYYVVSAVSSGVESALSSEVSAVPQPATNSPTLNCQPVQGQLQLSWPDDHKGWRLQVQTNGLAIGLSNNWVAVPNSDKTNQVWMPVGTTSGSVFLRLVYP